MKLKSKLSLSLGAALVTLLFSFGSAFAQCSRVIQNGTVSNNAAVVWVAPCVLGQAGPSSGSGGVGALPMINDLGVQGSLGLLDAPITGPYHQGLFDWSNTVAGEFDLNLSALGGAPGPTMAVIFNGTKFPFPGAGNGNVIAPTSPFPTAGDVPEWNGSTNLIDSGISIASILSSPTVANVTALKAYSISRLSAGFILNMSSYRTVGDMPADAYQLSLSACSLNAGAGDGFSQIPSNTSGYCWLIMPSSVYDVRQAGVVTGGTDPNNTNTQQINAVLNYVAALLQNSTSGTSSFPNVTCGGQFIGFDVGVITITGQTDLTNCSFKLIGPDSALVAGDGSSINRTIYTQLSGALTVPLWTPPDPYPTADLLPVGMLNVAQSASYNLVSIRNVSVDCGFEPNCATFVNQAALTYVQNPDFRNFTTYGMFTTGAWTMTDGNISESGNPTQWTGYDLYCAGGRLSGTTIDSQTKGTIISNAGIPVYANTQCGDFKLEDAHVWVGLTGTSTFGAFSGAVNMVLTSAGRYAITGNTFDQGAIVFKTGTGGTLPQAVFNDNIFESSGSTNDGWLVLQCGKSSGTCANNSNDANPATILSGQSYAKLQAPIYFPVVLEDINGAYNPSAWSQNIQRQAGYGNTFNSYLTPANNNIGSVASATFTGTVTNGSPIITNINVFPALGSVVTDNGGCIAASTTLMDFSYDQNKLFFAGSTAPTGTCPSDTVTVGGINFTANVSAGSWVASITSNTAWLMPGVNLDDTGSGGCLPVSPSNNNWIAGYNLHSRTMVFTNDSATMPGSTCVADTVTASPSYYYVQPSDAGNFIGAYNGATLAFSANMGLGWNALINSRGVLGTETLVFLPGATLNSTITGTITLEERFTAVDPIYTSYIGQYSMIMSSSLGVTCPAGSPSSSFATVNGFVTHC